MPQPVVHTQGNTLLWTSLAGGACLITVLAFLTQFILSQEPDQDRDVAAVIAAIEAEHARAMAESGVHFAIDDGISDHAAEDPERILQHLTQEAQDFSARHSLPADGQPRPLPAAVQAAAEAADQRRQDAEPRVRLGMDIALSSDPDGTQHVLVISLHNRSDIDLPISGQLLGLVGHNATGAVVWEHSLEMDPGILPQGYQWDWVAPISDEQRPPETMTQMALRYGSALTAGVAWPPQDQE
ncbi:MAG: hypothetical protein EA401_08960 [Planctomycetota bacterium]|nr:MAG: hypothetical protein EA401_08960 [Planctomycetota bacterium]